MWRLGSGLAALVLFVQAANAANFSWWTNQLTGSRPNELKQAVIVLEGTIEKGDAEKFRTLLNSIYEKGNYPATLSIYSPGGSVSEAIELGRMVRLLRLHTMPPMHVKQLGARTYLCAFTADGPRWGRNYPPGQGVTNNPGCTCLSACFLVWAAGGSRASGYIGVHRPFFDPKEFGQLSLDVARERYNAMLSHVLSYLSEMQIDKPVADKMMSASSTEFKLLTLDEMKLHEVPIADYGLDEYVIAKCGDVNSMEKNLYENYEKGHRDIKRYHREHADFMKQKWNCLQKYHDHLLVEAKRRWEKSDVR